MMCLRIHSHLFSFAITTLALSSTAFADGFELQDAYRSARQNHWQGNEFSLHYITQESDVLTFGAYFSNTSWRINKEKRGQVKEFGPEVRYAVPAGPFSGYAGFQYALFSDGSYTIDQHDVGMKVRGPRLTIGALYPVESIGLVLSFGVTNGWERMDTYADRHSNDVFESHSVFLGVSI
ncbi:MAG: hypothetical protein H7318_08370 [Oligoflexus sp.]|nr:hypothetical protein [Oligoflexus sp.]